jgi:hypothetical protein
LLASFAGELQRIVKMDSERGLDRPEDFGSRRTPLD